MYRREFVVLLEHSYNATLAVDEDITSREGRQSADERMNERYFCCCYFFCVQRKYEKMFSDIEQRSPTSPGCFSAYVYITDDVRIYRQVRQEMNRNEKLSYEWSLREKGDLLESLFNVWLFLSLIRANKHTSADQCSIQINWNGKNVLDLYLFGLKKNARCSLCVFPRLLQRRRNGALAYLIVHNRDNVEGVASMCIICVARL